MKRAYIHAWLRKIRCWGEAGGGEEQSRNERGGKKERKKDRQEKDIKEDRKKLGWEMEPSFSIHLPICGYLESCTAAKTHAEDLYFHEASVLDNACAQEEGRS